MISFLFLVYLYTCRLPDSFEHIMHAAQFPFTSFGVCTGKEIVALSQLKIPLLFNKSNCFHNGQTRAPFSPFFHSMLQTGQWTAFLLFSLNELFMS